MEILEGVGESLGRNVKRGCLTIPLAHGGPSLGISYLRFYPVNFVTPISQRERRQVQ
jgi:hypothetical protein